MNDLERLAILVDKVDSIESEVGCRVQELMESVGVEDFTKKQKELFASAFDTLDSALGDIQSCLHDFRATFSEVAIAQEFFISRYCTWTKISETKASGVLVNGSRTEEEFKFNTLVYTIPSDGGDRANQ